MAQETITLKAINKLTGEIFEVEVNPYDPESTAQCLLNIKEMAKELEKLEKDVKAVAEDYMAQVTLTKICSSPLAPTPWQTAPSKS